MSIADNIKALREKHNLSQKELALIAGVTDKAVSSWELGTREPRMGVIQKLADHFGIRKSDIIEDAPAPAPGEEKMDSRSRKQLKKFIDELEGAFEGGISTMTDDERAAVMEMMTDVFKFVKKANKRKK